MSLTDRGRSAQISMDSGFVQVPFRFRERSGLIQMSSCSGRDQVVVQLCQQGWRAYEAPLPLVLCELLRVRLAEAKPLMFVDVGANTGFYAILASLAGAHCIHAFEPVPAIAAILRANITASRTATTAEIHVHECALSERDGVVKLYLPHQGHGLVETSASLNPEFRAVHSDVFDVKTTTLDSCLSLHQTQQDVALVMKLDVETCEPAVLQGANATIARLRPWIVSEILPSSDIDFFYRWCRDLNYRHFSLLPPNQIVPADNIDASVTCRDHLFMPAELDLQQLLAS